MNWQAIFSDFRNDDLIYWFVPIFLAALALEFLYNRKNHLDLYERRDTRASLWMMVYVVFVDLLPKFVFFVLIYQLHELSPLRDVVQRQWWAWALLLVLDDFTYYWMHRANHEVRLFWAGHVSHHSAIKMNYATALRQGVGERLHKYLFWLPLPLLGFDALMIFTMMSINLFYQFWIHTELVNRLPASIEAVFNTPSHHRVHHASNHQYLDRNHGGIFILWDKWFGSFAAEHPDNPPIYGLTKNITSYRPIDVATHDYQAMWKDVRRAERWQDKLGYLFMAPGWSHDGEDRRSKILRQRAANSVQIRPGT